MFAMHKPSHDTQVKIVWSSELLDCTIFYMLFGSPSCTLRNIHDSNNHVDVCESDRLVGCSFCKKSLKIPKG